MKLLGIRLLAVGCICALVLGIAGCQPGEQAASPAKKTVLFNGKNFEGWKLHVDDENVDVDDVWSVQDGVVHCKGVPNGYMRTKKTYSNYKLHLEWRWAANPTNSGVLLHASGKDQVWPRCIEAQLKSGNAGDFVLIRHTGITADGKEYGDPDKMYVVVPKKEPSSEREAGKWNSYDIVCEGDSITLYVNGVLQNKGTKASDSSGWICLQSEGSPIEFRNIHLKSLP